MPPLAQRNLFHDKVRLTVTLTGIVFAVVLIVVELGLFFGFTVTTSNLIDHAGADLWVTSPKVPYVEMGVPFSERKLNQIRAVPSFAGIPTAPELCHRRPATDWENGTPQCPPMTPSTPAPSALLITRVFMPGANRATRTGFMPIASPSARRIPGGRRPARLSRHFSPAP